MGFFGGFRSRTARPPRSGCLLRWYWRSRARCGKEISTAFYLTQNLRTDLGHTPVVAMVVPLGIPTYHACACLGQAARHPATQGRCGLDCSHACGGDGVDGGVWWCGREGARRGLRGVGLFVKAFRIAMLLLELNAGVTSGVSVRSRAVRDGAMVRKRNEIQAPHQKSRKQSARKPQADHRRTSEFAIKDSAQNTQLAGAHIRPSTERPVATKTSADETSRADADSSLGKTLR